MTIYIESGIPAKLIPVAFVGYAKSPIHDITGCINAVVKVKRGHGGYKNGDIAHIPPRHVLEKIGRRNYGQLVKPASLPAIDTANLMNARV